MIIYARVNLRYANKTIILVMLMLCIRPLFSDVTEPEEKETKKTLTYSLVFPGLGQICSGNYLKGAIFAGSELLCLAGVLINGARGEDYYRQYRSATRPEDVVSARRMTEKYDRYRNTFLIAGAVVWIANLVDMSITVKKKKLSVKVAHEENRISFGFAMAF